MDDVADSGDDVDDEGTSEDDEQEDFTPPDFESFYADIKDEWDVSEAEARELYDSIDTSGGDKDDGLVAASEKSAPASSTVPKPVLELERSMLEPMETVRSKEALSEHDIERIMNLSEQDAEAAMGLQDGETNAKLAAIQEALPGLPLSRAKKVLRTFEKSLNYPSMLELVPILRENMPDHLTAGWLKRRNVRNAEVVLQQAEEEGVVDVPIMNGALQVKTSAGSLDQALACHEDEFEKNGLVRLLRMMIDVVCFIALALSYVFAPTFQTPTAYSDRLVLQMLVRSNRLSRALAFKQKVEEDGRHLDVISYGSLIEYYGNQGKLGSAMLVLKECLNTHGAPPGAKSLAKLRLLCRQHDMETKLRLEELIGKDPMEWLRHGEANLKRETSYKGRRDVNLARNRMVQA